MKYATIGFVRDDGDFEVLAALNNGSDAISDEVFTALTMHLVSILRTETEDDTIHAMYRQDIPDVVQLDEGA